MMRAEALQHELEAFLQARARHDPQARALLEAWVALCPQHGKPAKLGYPCCVGSKGGRTTSPWKAQRSRENLALARAAKAAKNLTPSI